MKPQMRTLAIAVLLLVLAWGLRIILLPTIPPGLTHDEANHGREALGVLDGVFLYYFPFNYGSEPLYSYAVAGLMGLIGKHLFALRLLNVLSSMLTIAVTFAWARRAWRADGRMVAMAAAASMAVGFWPVAASREALRAGLLPLITALAAVVLWQMVAHEKGRKPAGPLLLPFLLALLIGAAFHNYLAARVWWIIFPALLLYLLIVSTISAENKTTLQRLWQPLTATMLMAALFVAPMFAYLRRHPEMQPRIQMLDGTLNRLISGEFGPFISNATRAILGLFVPGYGDQFLAYNIPGKPVFDFITGLFFIIGFIVCLIRWRRPAYAFALLWLGAGLIPSLLTGPTANTTRNAAALPVLYLMVGLGFGVVVAWLQPRLQQRFAEAYRPVLIPLLAFLWITLSAGATANNYFQKWAQDPDVRAAYQNNLVESLAYLDADNAAVVSSVEPGAAHDISISMAILGRAELPWHGVDARLAFIIPNEMPAQVVIPHATPLHPAFAEWLIPRQTVQLRESDINPEFTLYDLAAPLLPPANGPSFNDGVTLLDAQWLANPVTAGSVAEMMSWWRVDAPERLGERVLPALTTDLVLFTHVLRDAENILVQQDALHAPSWSWQEGDVVVQIHQIWIGGEIPAGTYQTHVGLYERSNLTRLPVFENGAATGATTAIVSPLIVEE